MTNDLDLWLRQATRCLSADATQRVRSEVRDHVDSAYEAALLRGAAAEDAERTALEALGDARVANAQYRSVMLTSAEARVLRQTVSEARFICSRSWLKKLIPSLPGIGLLASALLMMRGSDSAAKTLLCGSLVMVAFLMTPYLPVYTPRRSRVIRWLRWALLVAVFAYGLMPEGVRWSWLFFPALWPLVHTERLRASIRKKMPVADWPRSLYL